MNELVDEINNVSTTAYNVLEALLERRVFDYGRVNLLPSDLDRMSEEKRLMYDCEQRIIEHIQEASDAFMNYLRSRVAFSSSCICLTHRLQSLEEVDAPYDSYLFYRSSLIRLVDETRGEIERSHDPVHLEYLTQRVSEINTYYTRAMEYLDLYRELYRVKGLIPPQWSVASEGEQSISIEVGELSTDAITTGISFTGEGVRLGSLAPVSTTTREGLRFDSLNQEPVITMNKEANTLDVSVSEELLTRHFNNPLEVKRVRVTILGKEYLLPIERESGRPDLPIL